jgi:hypothetical protein
MKRRKEIETVGSNSKRFRRVLLGPSIRPDPYRSWLLRISTGIAGGVKRMRREKNPDAVGQLQPQEQEEPSSHYSVFTATCITEAMLRGTACTACRPRCTGRADTVAQGRLFLSLFPGATSRRFSLRTHVSGHE